MTLNRTPSKKKSKPRAKSQLTRPGPKMKAKPRNQKVMAPVASAQRQTTMVPRIINQTNSRTGVRCTRFVHSELVTTVYGSVGFVANAYTCNPGLASTFVWLSSQASGFEQYRFNKLTFRYVTRSSTATAGSVLLAPEYDVQDPLPATESAMSTYANCVEDATWRDLSVHWDVPTMFAIGPRKYVRSAAIGGADLKTYDAGYVIVATTGQADNSAVGKLWVDYDVTLYSPQIASSTPVATSTSYYTISSDTVVTGGGAVIAFDTVVLDALGIGAGSSGVFTPPKGVYYVTYATCSTNSVASTSCKTYLELRKNGATITGAPTAVQTNQPGAGTQQVSTTGTYVVSCSGTDTVSLKAIGIAASGTISATAYNTTLVFRVA